MLSTASLKLALVALALPPVVAAQAAPDRWFVTEMGQLVTEPAVWWVTDNARYFSANEPFVRYATRWTAEDDGRTVSGRLVAVDTAGKIWPMWTYRMYWHPGERRGYLMQTSSWGAYASGPLRLDSTSTLRTVLNDQEMFQPDGSASRSRHRSWFPNDSTHQTESFRWQDGAWAPSRTYVWIRQRLEPAGGG